MDYDPRKRRREFWESLMECISWACIIIAIAGSLSWAIYAFLQVYILPWLNDFLQ